MAGVVKSITCTSGVVTAATGGLVAYGDVQDVHAGYLLGRGSSGGDGSVQEITIGSGLSLSGTTLSASSTYAAEDAQDDVGGILDAGSNGQVAFTYDDATPRITGNLSARGHAAIMARISMRG